MSLTSGSRLGPYEILSALGAGGMGEVYRAHDSKLNRDVAIKVLLPAVVNDPDRLARFSREAQVLASLNHPNISHIYGLEEAGGVIALVLELVEGEDLAQRIARGPIPLDEALPIAKQIADALEAAHEQGIIHRDLKPANIKVRPDGTVKVLDFGLAKAMDPPGGSSANAMNSPTLSMHATQAGIILGTAAYMSPEQAKGKAVDARADIWAFGAVFYEMLTGTRAFAGEDISDTMVAVLSKDPDWTRLPNGTPARVRDLLRRCLEREAKMRLQAIGEARIQLDDLLSGKSDARTPGGEGAAPLGAVGRGRYGWMAAAVLAVALIVLGVAHVREQPPTIAPELRLDITTPPTSSPLSFALSPDGRSIVFVAFGARESQLWLRRFDQTDAHPVAGTEGALSPFWSPDGKSIAFGAAGTLKRVDASGGAVVQVSAAASGNGGTWSRHGVILFEGTGGVLLRVPASGGPATEISADVGRLSRRLPEFLPDGHRFLYSGAAGTEAAGLYLASLDDPVGTRLSTSGSRGKWLLPDKILYMEQNQLVVRRVDLDRKVLVGDPGPIADNVSGFSVSEDGRIAYRSGESLSARHIVWLDRSGKPMATLGDVDIHDGVAPALSPDGKRLAVDRTVQGNRDIWIWDLIRRGMTRLTFNPAVDGYPVWSFDGSQVAFESTRTGNFDIYIKSSNGAGVEQALLTAPGNQWPLDCSKDGTFLLYYDAGNAGDLLALPLSGNERTPVPVATTPFMEQTGSFSPDGKWVAYGTNESGRFEVVVQAFPHPSGKWQVSTAGGQHPRWNGDGHELYFLAGDAMMAASIRPAGVSLEVGRPFPLFKTRMVIDLNATAHPPYDVTGDGRFIVNQVSEASTASPITILLNWKPKS